MFVYVVVVQVGCTDHKLEKQFFQQPLQNRLERLRQYPLEEQYRIFRYGNDVVHPPLTDLAIPIAERGAGAVPFLMTKLESEQDDFAVRDILRIVEEMTLKKTYDAKADEGLMHTLSRRVNTMRDQEWRAISAKMLDQIRQG
jgi:hypothetical protein